MTIPIWGELADGARYAHERMLAIWEEVRPDVVVIDCVTGFPAIPLAGVPWVRIVSANPLEMPDPAIPPVFSGYPADDRTGWDAFRAEYARLSGPPQAAHSAFSEEVGAGPLPDGQFQYVSPWLNLSMFPEAADYARATPLGPEWERVDPPVRASDPDFDIAARLPGDGPLIYLSLGSLGCMDTPLMQRFIDVLGRTGHRVIVSMGPRGEELTLGERMYGEAFLPQAAIVPQCDLVITHGGNNTVGECFTFGLPMIVHPLFWDQYDNAQRVDELGFGVRLRSYTWTDDELLDAVARLLGPEGPAERMRPIGERLRAAPGRLRAAERIEALVPR